MFHAVSSASFWFERRLTPAGMLIAAAAVLAGALGVDTTLSLAYQSFAFLAALIVAAALCLPLMRARVAVERELPRVATAGEPFVYRVRISNTGTAAVGGLTLIEELPDPRPTLAAFRAAVQFPTYRAWKRVVDSSRMVRITEHAVPPLSPGGTAEVAVQARAVKRGIVHSRGVTIARADPLGLMKALRPFGGQANLVVLPRRYRVPPFALPGARRYQQGGVSLATSVGDSGEFLSLRDYRPGDPLQHIHWKSFARAARPVVKEYQDEFFERHALVLDTFAPPGTERHFEEAVSIAASFTCTIETRESLLDLMFIGAEAYSYTTGRGQLVVGGLLEILAGVQPCRDRPFSSLTEAVLARRQALSGCICVLLGWNDERQAFAQAVRSNGLPLRVIVVSETPIENPQPWLLVVEPGRVAEGLEQCRSWA